MALVNTFYTIAPTMQQDLDFQWLPVLDVAPPQSEDSSQIALEVIQTEMTGQDRFTISAVDRKSLPVLEVIGDNFVGSCRIYIAALSMQMQVIAANPTIVLVI